MAVRYFVLFVSLAAAASATAIEATVEETQELLREWNLHHVLGREFHDLKYDGKFLDIMEESDFHQERFPRATPLHWKVLLRRVESHRRALAAKPPKTDDFVGVRMENDKSLVTFGKAQDVKLVRTGPRQLSLFADRFIVDGVDLKKQLADALARIKQLESDAKASKNFFEPIKSASNWVTNKNAKWTHSPSAGTITNTAAPADWLVAGWTGKKLIQKNVRVSIQEIKGPGRLGAVYIGHPGVIYHYLDDKNWEGFYFRPHSTGTTSAIQFVCHIAGKASYPGGNSVKVPTDGSWFTTTVRVTGTQATLSVAGLKWTVNRCAKNVAGGVGVFNHESTTSFKGMQLCSGADCKLPVCSPCPKNMLLDTPCSGTSDRTCKPNLLEPIRKSNNWNKNAEGKWTHSVPAGTITNTGNANTWLVAGYTGATYVTKKVRVSIQEIEDKGRLGKVDVGHPGIIYHYQDDKNWEGFYFRPHSSGTKSAIQFICHIAGKASYPSGNNVKIPTDGSWFNAEVTVTESKATLVMEGLKWTVDRCTKNKPGGVGVFNHESSSSFRGMLLCEGATCELPECKPCPEGFLVETVCIGKAPATCRKNLFKPISHEKSWTKNAEGKWTHSASKGTITNTGAGNTWLTAGWTGRKFIEKVVSVDIQEIKGPGRLGGVHIGHPGIIYHYVDNKNWEGFYFRPHSTGTSSAIQFVCHVAGKASYPGGNSVKVPTNGAFFNVKVKVTSTQATLIMAGRTWTVNRCAKNVAGGVGIFNHESSSNFKNMLLCQGSKCELK